MQGLSGSWLRLPVLSGSRVRQQSSHSSFPHESLRASVSYDLRSICFKAECIYHCAGPDDTGKCNGKRIPGSRRGGAGPDDPPVTGVWLN